MPALGDTVLVRGLTFSQQMQYGTRTEMGKHSHVAGLLCMTVLAADGESLFTEEQWELFGAQHLADVITLYNTAKRLSGLDEEAVAKK